MFDGIRCATLMVADLPSAQAWYAEVLDCPAVQDWTGRGVMFSLNGYQLQLLPGEPGGATTVFWSVDHLEGEVARLTDLGAKVMAAPSRIDPHSRLVTLLDPFGNPLGLIERSDPAELRARAQRAAEKIALRNVRGTLDQLQASEPDARLARRLLMGSVVVALLVIAAFLYVVLPTPAAKPELRLLPVAPASQPAR